MDREGPPPEDVDQYGPFLNVAVEKDQGRLYLPHGRRLLCVPVHIIFVSTFLV